MSSSMIFCVSAVLAVVSWCMSREAIQRWHPKLHIHSQISMIFNDAKFGDSWNIIPYVLWYSYQFHIYMFFVVSPTEHIIPATDLCITRIPFSVSSLLCVSRREFTVSISKLSRMAYLEWVQWPGPLVTVPPSCYGYIMIYHDRNPL